MFDSFYLAWLCFLFRNAGCSMIWKKYKSISHGMASHCYLWWPLSCSHTVFPKSWDCNFTSNYRWLLAIRKWWWMKIKQCHRRRLRRRSTVSQEIIFLSFFVCLSFCYSILMKSATNHIDVCLLLWLLYTFCVVWHYIYDFVWTNFSLWISVSICLLSTHLNVYTLIAKWYRFCIDWHFNGS